MASQAFSRKANAVYGVVIAIVVDNKDPEGRYRVKVKYPWVLESNAKYTDKPDEGDFISNWARISTSMAGSKDGADFRGSFFLPEVDDEVLVMFEHGDVRRPIVMGSLWNGVDKPIHDNSEKGPQEGKNNFRSIRSRSGHMITFHDDHENEIERIIIQTKVKDGEEHGEPLEREGHMIVLDHSTEAEKIQIYDHKKTNFIEIESSTENPVEDKITCRSDHGSITIAAPEGTVKVDCTNFVLTAQNTALMHANVNMSHSAGGNIDISAGGLLSERASLIKLN
mgnify:CR=1 FL=1